MNKNGVNENGKTAVSSKLLKTKVLLGDPELARRVPATEPFSRERLRAMLDRHGMVYAKPDTGSQGIGVIRVEQRDGGYRYQSGERICRFGSLQAMYGSLRVEIGSRRYLIQQGVRALRYEGRPFDFRVMVQRNPSRRWECTGTAARVAPPGKIVSNGSQGGTIFSPDRLMGPIAGSARAQSLLRRMERLALRTAAAFARTYPAMNELGLDIAVDRNLTPWILEVNTRPDPCPFAKLDDPASIRKIVRYGKAYGRRYCLKCAKAKKAP
ncbi:YheC/YheD family protein [Cohnella sp. REN36]|uniref:YheC/YheD family protein n=1 Tax=Cohnella sp. REN36 TaxID=2887347 RepID=UPI001D1516A7|nr:YheC/YheD family protein [Cohnella sp. REN36]MCC3374527.1 YheC/YheD family protein [Cohnella sp. REN36]